MQVTVASFHWLHNITSAGRQQPDLAGLEVGLIGVPMGSGSRPSPRPRPGASGACGHLGEQLTTAPGGDPGLAMLGLAEGSGALGAPISIAKPDLLGEP